MQTYTDLSEIKHLIAASPMAILVSKTSSCGVCESVAAKIDELLPHYPKVTGMISYIEQVPALASEYLILGAPTVILFVEGKEVYRESRFVKMAELHRQLQNWSEAIS